MKTGEYAGDSSGGYTTQEGASHIQGQQANQMIQSMFGFGSQGQQSALEDPKEPAI